MQENALNPLHVAHRSRLGVAVGKAATAGTAERLRFWDIDHFFKCPLVGICLTTSEAKQLLKKAGCSFKGMSPYEIHEMLVSTSDSENRISRKVDGLLARKFQQQTPHLHSLSEDEFLQHWRTCFDGGNMQGAFWAAATRADLSVQAKRLVFGDVHMAMHGNADDIAKLRQRLLREQTKSLRDNQKYEREVRARKALQKEKRVLERDLKTLQEELAGMKRYRIELKCQLEELKNRSFQELQEENGRLRAELERLAGQIKQQIEQLAVSKKENQRLAGERDRQLSANAQIREELAGLVQQFVEVSDCSTDCPTFDLCRKRILIVGGVTRMESLYRQLIESSGGILEYHDGNLKSGLKNLEGRLRRADVVLCPVNCNSHAACSMVKKLGKKYNKTVHMLSNSSLSGVSQVIWECGMNSHSKSIERDLQSNS